MASTDEKVKVILDISDVVVKRAQEINEAKKAEKEKIAALKRETAAAAKEDKEAWANAVAAARKAAAEEEAIAKKAAADRAAVDKKATADKAREDKQAFEFAVRLAKQEAAEKEKLARRLSTMREAEFAVRMETATEAVQNQRINIDALRGRMNLLGEGLGKAGSAAAALGPEFGGLAQNMQKAGGAASALLTSMSAFGGPVGVAVGVALGAATLAWGAHQEKVEANKKALEDANAEAEKTSSIFGQLAEDLFEATLQQQVLNETITQAEADIQRAAHGINKAYGPALDEAKDKMDALKVSIMEQQKIIDNAGKSGASFATVNKARAEQKKLNAELGRAEEAYDRLQASMNNLSDTQTDNIGKSAKIAKAAKAEKEAVDEVTTAVDGGMFMSDEAYALQQAEAEQKVEWRKRDAEAAKQAIKDAKDVADAKVEASKRAIEAREKEEAAEKALQEQRMDAAATTASTAANIADAIGSLYEDAADRSAEHVSDLQEEREEALEEGNESLAKVLEAQIEAEKESALKQWNNAHKLAIAAAGLDLVAGIAKAATGAPWPFNLALMAGAAATGTANLVAVKNQEPPEFDDTPQVMQAAQNNRTNVSLKGGDLFAAAQTPAALKQQVDAMAGGNRTMRIADRMNDLLVGRSMTRDLRMVMGRA